MLGKGVCRGRIISVEYSYLKEEIMGRQIRRVPADWVHPKGKTLCDEMPVFTESEIQEGLEEGWLCEYLPNYGLDIMPEFDNPTHYQMYETTTEGTPISPVLESPEAVAKYLAENNVPVFADATMEYEQWLNLIKSQLYEGASDTILLQATPVSPSSSLRTN